MKEQKQAFTSEVLQMAFFFFPGYSTGRFPLLLSFKIKAVLAREHLPVLSNHDAGVVGFPISVCSLNPDRHRHRQILISVKWLQIFFDENFQN